MHRRPWSLLVLLVLTFTFGCGRCGRGGPGGARDVAALLPRDAQAAVVVPELGRLGEKLARLQRLKLASFVAQLQGFPSAEAYVGAVVRQVGVDLRSREAMEKAGLDPERGAGLALLGPGRGYTVLGVKDAGAFEKTFAELARTRLGATERQERQEAGRRVVTFARGGSVQLALVFTRHFALVGVGALAAELPGYSTLPTERTLAGAPQLAASLERLPRELDLYAFLPGGAGALVPPGTVEAVTVTGLLEDKAVTLRADAPWPDTEASLAALVAHDDGPPLLGYLPQDSFLVARFRGDPAQVGSAWTYVTGAGLARLVQESGFDVQGEVLGNLQPGAVAGLALAPTAQLGLGLPAMDVRRTNPFRWVHLVAVGQARDAARARATLDKLPAVAPRLGFRATPAEVAGQHVLLTEYRAGEGAHLAEVGGKVVLAAPRERLEKLVGTLLQPPAARGPLAEDLRPALDAHTLALVLDLRRLAQAIKDLPSEAWGIGGFAIKQSAVRWLDATDDLRAVTFGLSSRGRALQAELSLKLTPPPPAPGEDK